LSKSASVCSNGAVGRRSRGRAELGTALRLARYFGGDAQSWMNLQIAHDLRKTVIESGRRIDSEVAPRAA